MTHTNRPIKRQIIWRMSLGVREEEAKRLAFSEIPITGGIALEGIRQAMGGFPDRMVRSFLRENLIAEARAFFPISPSKGRNNLNNLPQ